MRGGVAKISSKKLFVTDLAANKKTPENYLNAVFRRLPTFPHRSIIGSTRLNCRVRNENGCDPCDESPEHNLQIIIFRSLFDSNKWNALS